MWYYGKKKCGLLWDIAFLHRVCYNQLKCTEIVRKKDMDETVSALDENTEARIFQRISKLQGKTCFIITHRKSMLRYCDMLLTIDSEGCATLTEGHNENSLEKEVH